MYEGAECAVGKSADTIILTDQLLITVEFLSHINVNMKMCVI